MVTKTYKIINNETGRQFNATITRNDKKINVNVGGRTDCVQILSLDPFIIGELGWVRKNGNFGDNRTIFSEEQRMGFCEILNDRTMTNVSMTELINVSLKALRKLIPSVKTLLLTDNSKIICNSELMDLYPYYF